MQRSRESIGPPVYAPRFKALRTCVRASAVGVPVVVVVPVLGGEPHAGSVGQGVGQVPREVADVEAVAPRGALQREAVLGPVLPLLPVLQVDAQDVDPLLGEAVDLL